MTDTVKIFSDLNREVIEKGICGKCGGCVSFCSAGNLMALEMADNGLPRYLDEDKCKKCGICYLICPQTNTLDSELQEKFAWSPPIGPYKKIVSAQTTIDDVKAVCTDGGVVTSLLLYLLERNMIDGAIVSKREGFKRQAMIAKTSEELIEAAGSGFSGSQHLEELGGKYTTYTPILSAIKSLEKRYLHDVAVVGTPCQINSIRKMQCLDIIPAHLIKYTIGLFCIESFSFDDLARERLENKLDINFQDVVKLNIKDDFQIALSNGVKIHVPLEEVDEVARPACFACRDFSNEYADISVGGLGSPDRYTTIVIRTGTGAALYDDALKRGYIQERVIKDIKEGELETTRILAKIKAFTKKKRNRAKMTLEGLK